MASIENNTKKKKQTVVLYARMCTFTEQRKFTFDSSCVWGEQGVYASYVWGAAAAVVAQFAWYKTY